MLDNNTACTIKSRYKNKFLNCELIILTTVLDIDTFYKNVFSENDEPITQLKRRCGTYIQMDEKNISVSIWDSKLMHYTAPVIYKNSILVKYVPVDNKNKSDVITHVTNLMPFLEPQNENRFNSLTKSEKSQIPFELATNDEPMPFD